MRDAESWWSNVITSVEPSCWRNVSFIKVISRVATRLMPSSASPILSSTKSADAICLSSRELIFFVRCRLAMRMLWPIYDMRFKSLAPVSSRLRKSYIDLFRLGPATMFLVGRDDALHQRMPHHVALGKFDDGNAFRVLERAMRLGQPGMFVRRQINLRLIAGDDRLRAVTEPREKHQHLLRRGILRLVQNNKRTVQRATAHVGQRRDLNRRALHVLGDVLGGQHVVQRVVQRTQIRRDFFQKVARQKAQRLAGLDRKST